MDARSVTPKCGQRDFVDIDDRGGLLITLRCAKGDCCLDRFVREGS
jgi:hypothetical protein